MIAYLLGVLTPIVVAGIVWKVKGLTLIRVEAKQQVVQVTIWPGEWAIGCAARVRDYTV